MQKCEDGFTLLELMIVMLIVAILASIAYPSYTSYMQSSRRTYAKTALMDIASQLERAYFSSAGNSGASCAIADPSASSVDLTERAETGGYYRITGSSDDSWESEYKLEAKPIGSQAGDTCGVFTLDQLGRHGLEDNTDSQANCGW
ncbi:MAG: type IV pilin protein [Pseudomonadota bacterium]|nr:type IV pilin protein [Pseudomonadota bacterium]